MSFRLKLMVPRRARRHPLPSHRAAAGTYARRSLVCRRALRKMDLTGGSDGVGRCCRAAEPPKAMPALYHALAALCCGASARALDLTVRALMQLSAPTDFTSAREAGRWWRIHPEDRSERGGANRPLATAALPRPVSKSTGWTAHAHCTGRAAAPRSGHGIRGSMQPACQPSFAAFRVPGNFFPPSGRLPNDRGRCCVKNHCAGHPRRRRCCGIVRRRAAAATLRSFPRTSVLADSIDLLNCLRRRQNLRHTVQRQEAAPDRGCGVRHSMYMDLAARLELPACARWQV